MKSKSTLRAESIAAITCMTVDEAKRDIRSVRETYGLGFDIYLEHHFYQLDDDERRVVANKIKARRKRDRAKREAQLREASVQLAAQANISEDEAYELLREANKRLGIGPKTYVKHRFDLLSFDEQQSKYERVLASTERKKKKLDGFAVKVALASSLSFEEARADIKKTEKQLGIDPATYVERKLFEVPWDDRKQVCEK